MLREPVTQFERCRRLAIANRVQLGVQAALGSPDAAGNSSFLSRLAAVPCAFRWVASIINWSGFPPLAAKAAMILSNMPKRLQRMNRLSIVLGGPYSAGTSHHRRPLRITTKRHLCKRFNRSLTWIDNDQLGRRSPGHFEGTTRLRNWRRSATRRSGAS